MASPTWFDVAAFLGDDDVDATLAIEHLSAVSAMVKAYTRGRGFDVATGQPADDLALVIVSSAARSLRNPEHTVTATIDDYSVRYGIFNGWTLPELAVLHRYRRRAA